MGTKDIILRTIEEELHDDALFGEVQPIIEFLMEKNAKEAKKMLDDEINSILGEN